MIVAAPTAPVFAERHADELPQVVQMARLHSESEVELVARIHARVAAELAKRGDATSPEAIRLVLAEQVQLALEEERVVLSRSDRIRIQEAVFAETCGYGPLQEPLADGAVSEIMVNGPHDVWVERDGVLYPTDVAFVDAGHVLRVIGRIVGPLGRRCDESSPMVDARLPDGSRVNAIIPPLSLVGPVLTIRKFRKVVLTPDALIANGSITAEALDHLRAYVRGRLNVVVAGGSGSGKTTLLNVLSGFISPRERIVTIEDAAELRLQQRHVVTLETRPANAEGHGEVTMRDLFRNALRMRPDRIVVGECRGGEALDMLQAMNTGHDGSLTTVHANGTRDALLRIETMALMAGGELPLSAIREQIAAAIQLVVYVERMPDGHRRVTRISAVDRVAEGQLGVTDLFVHDSATHRLRATHARPAFLDRLIERGAEVP